MAPKIKGSPTQLECEACRKYQKLYLALVAIVALSGREIAQFILTGAW